MFHTLTKHGHAAEEPQELDFMGEIKRRALCCEDRSGGLALTVQETSEGESYRATERC